MKVVCFSEIQWQYLRTRKQQILSRFPADWEILFLSSVVRGKRNNFFPEREGRIVHVCVPVFKNFPQKAIQALFSFPPMRFLWNVVVYLWLNVVLLLTGFGGRRRVFFVSNIYYAAVLPFLTKSLLLYDCNDDHLGFPNTPRWARGYYRKLALSADVVTTVTSGLVRQLQETGVREVHHIGNGVDYDLFNAAAAAGAPEDMRSLPRPVFGYVGAIAPWFDFELVDRIAAAFPSASLALVGPVYTAVCDTLEALVEKRANVHAIGTKPYDELGAYIASMDVCLIPLEVNELRRLADPNKLYEYAACGRPIVTMTYSEDMDELADMVYLAKTRDEFVECVGTALSRGTDGEKLRAFAKRRSWQARADAIAALIVEALDRPSP